MSDPYAAALFEYDLLPSDIQASYREAFTFSFKRSPEEAADKFKAYVAEDPDILAAIRRRQARQRHSISENHHSGVDATSSHRSSLGSTVVSQDISEGLIYSSSQGPDILSRYVSLLKGQKDSNRYHPISGLNPDLSLPSSLTSVAIPIDIAGGSTLLKDYLFLGSDEEDLAGCLADRAERLAERIIQSTHPSIWRTPMGNEAEVVNISEPVATTESIIVGRITSDAEGPLNEHSLLLEGISGRSQGVSLPFLISGNISDCFLVPGQTVAVLGAISSDSRGRRIIPTKLVPGLPTSPAKVGLTTLGRVKNLKTGAAKLIVACGPYAPSKCLDYSRLDQLLEIAAEEKPDALILLGPFVDIKNDIVERGDLVVRREQTHNKSSTASNDDDTPITFKDVYRRIFRRLEQSKLLENHKMKVFLQPSPHDIATPYPIPQPPFHLEDFGVRSISITSIDNPAILDVSGIKIALTSLDVVAPLMSTALALGTAAKERIKAALSLFIEQSTFFPAWPPPSPVDPSRFRKEPCVFEEHCPPILIFSADRLPASVKCLGGRVLINTGRIAGRGQSSFCVISIGCPQESSDENNHTADGEEKEVAVDVTTTTKVTFFKKDFRLQTSEEKD